jgi:hypothetical protein
MLLSHSNRVVTGGQLLLCRQHFRPHRRLLLNLLGVFVRAHILHLGLMLLRPDVHAAPGQCLAHRICPHKLVKPVSGQSVALGGKLKRPASRAHRGGCGWVHDVGHVGRRTKTARHKRIHDAVEQLRRAQPLRRLHLVVILPLRAQFFALDKPLLNIPRHGVVVIRA